MSEIELICPIGKTIYFSYEIGKGSDGFFYKSIGLISDCGKTFYAEFTDFEPCESDSFTNVLGAEYCVPETYSVHAQIEYNVSVSDFCIKASHDTVFMALEEWLDQFRERERFDGVKIKVKIKVIGEGCVSGGIYDNRIKKETDIKEIDIANGVRYSLKGVGVEQDICLNSFSGIVSEDGFLIGKHGNRYEEKRKALFDAMVIKACDHKILILETNLCL